MKRIVLITVGSIALALGTVGVVLPILPTVPFYLLAAFCYANSSEKLHDWFVSTDLYRNNLESYVQKKGMTIKTKISIITSVTVLMGFGFFMMSRKNLTIPCVILAIVWIIHALYFSFAVKTIKDNQVG